MRSRARRLFTDAFVSAAVVGGVLAVLVTVDPRVREQVGVMVDSTSPSSVSVAGTQLGEVGFALVEAARTQSVDHAPLMIFVVTATVLVLWMVRT